uniref:Solute carrier family 2, facilitated glucose transporter member 7 n=1 Tax=Ascaris suum TaxID=6253 RepID=F1KXB7_ASCSU
MATNCEVKFNDDENSSEHINTTSPDQPKSSSSTTAIESCHVTKPFENYALDDYVARGDNKPEENLEMHKTSLRVPSFRLLVTGIIVVLGGGFHFGFQISLINPLAETLQTFMAESIERRYDVHFTEISSRVFWSSVAGILFIGAVIGAAVIPSIMAKIGARWSFVISSSIMCIGLAMGALSKFAHSAEMFVISRLIVGICVGMGTTLQGVFLTEISPVYCRGCMGTLAGLSTNIGFVIASALGLPQLLGTPILWPLCFYVEIIPCIILLLFSIFMLNESPVEFLRRGDEKQARTAISFYYRPEQHNNETMKQLQMELHSNVSNMGWKYIFTDRPTRRALYFSVLLNVTVSFSGVMAVSFFGTFLLGGIGFTTNGAALANCLSSLSGTAGAIIGSLTVDKIGRRFLIVGSLISLAVVNTGMMALVWVFLQYHILWLGYCFLFLFIVFLFVFSVGVGPMAWFISTELAGPSCRSRVQSISTSAQYITCFVCPIIYSPLQKLTGPLSFMLFIIPLSFSAAYIYSYMPETQQRSARHIRLLLDEGKRYFKTETDVGKSQKWGRKK